MPASEEDGHLPLRRSTRTRIQNINRQQALTLAEAAQERARLVSGKCRSAVLVIINVLRPSKSSTQNLSQAPIKSPVLTVVWLCLQCPHLLCLQIFSPMAERLGNS
jgi:hypothetical protein